jgi:hypothetical protein
MTYLAKYDFFYFSRCLESCSSASNEMILNFSKDLKSPVHAIFAIYYDKFSFKQVFWTKKPCGFAYRANFLRFLCVSHRSWWGEPVATATFPPPLAAPAPLVCYWSKPLAIVSRCYLIPSAKSSRRKW